MSKDHDATPEVEHRAHFKRALLGGLQALEHMLEAARVDYAADYIDGVVS
jgi:hypothetical protein